MLKLLKKYGKNKPAALTQNKRYWSRRAPRLVMGGAVAACAAMQISQIVFSNSHPLVKIIALGQHQIQSMKAVSAAMNYGRRKVVIKQTMEKEHGQRN